MSDFLNMGGYAVYVWGSYAAAAAVFAWNLAVPLLRRRALRRELHAGQGEAS